MHNLAVQSLRANVLNVPQCSFNVKNGTFGEVVVGKRAKKGSNVPMFRSQGCGHHQRTYRYTYTHRWYAHPRIRNIRTLNTKNSICRRENLKNTVFHIRRTLKNSKNIRK